MNVILGFLGMVFGLGKGASVPNTAGGIVNHAALIGGLTYLIQHRDELVTFTASYGSLAVAGGVVWLILEVIRRTSPGAPGAA